MTLKSGKETVTKAIRPSPHSCTLAKMLLSFTVGLVVETTEKVQVMRFLTKYKSDVTESKKLRLMHALCQ